MKDNIHIQTINIGCLVKLRAIILIKIVYRTICIKITNEFNNDSVPTFYLHNLQIFYSR